jgi:hypothetical protein
VSSMTAKEKARTSERRRGAPRSCPRMTSATALKPDEATVLALLELRLGRDLTIAFNESVEHRNTTRRLAVGAKFLFSSRKKKRGARHSQTAPP